MLKQKKYETANHLSIIKGEIPFWGSILQKKKKKSRPSLMAPVHGLKITAKITSKYQHMLV